MKTIQMDGECPQGSAIPSTVAITTKPGQTADQHTQTTEDTTAHTHAHTQTDTHTHTENTLAQSARGYFH